MQRELIDFNDDLYDELQDSYGLDEEQSAFTIDDMEKASWASRKLLGDEAEKQRIKAWGEREIARIQGIVYRHTTSIDNRMGFLTGHLHSYLNRLIQTGEIKKKSLDLPGGKIAVRSGKDKIVIEDEDAVIAYLEAADETSPIKIKKSVLKTELAKVTTPKGSAVLLDATGEPLPGTHIEPATEAFSFKPALEE